MRVFWELSGQVDRLWHDEQRLDLQVAVAAQNPDAAEKMVEYLDKVAPGPFKLSGYGQMQAKSELDEAGLAALQALS